MPRKPRIDAFGAASLTGFALLLAFNQVVIKVTNEGLQPVFFAALRSLGGALLIYGWIRWRGLSLTLPRATLPAGLLIGAVFAFEFVCLFIALDLTTVTRTSVIFYTMPIWLALAAHVLIPAERLTRAKSAGLALAFGGVVVALASRGDDGQASLLGDLFALGGALGWAGIALIVRVTKLKEVRPEVQLLWQLAVSAPILFVAAAFFGPALRDPSATHWAGLGFQIVAIVSAGFLFWFWLLTIYPASSVASFAFLAPVFGVGLGWLMLGEPVGPDLVVALVLVCAGLILVNRPSPRAADG
ncbi:DMT family transporter [Roseibacterium sp. SDUM158017]|uniref:DMT family transporter n=1 Tax=Roseicyclus salinarum TaxID=3036773 RepID=UPI002415877F|nr:DMT family transporter [Roseibacterium sp. SDUM158017]MDG4648484.1 DMT family transporter [Roseibacterium sp. SDUM158017]